MSDDNLDDFRRLMGALAPWRDQLVVVGGWAHRLYWMHPKSEYPGHLPVTTRDADLAFRAEERLAGNISKALLAANFREELFGDHHPPASHYVLGDDTTGFYAEFLTPLIGAGRKRDGTADATLSRAGITAQKLRHLDILLSSPWCVRDAAASDATLRVANPVAFVVQKLLIQSERKPNKRAQDMLYIHDTLELFGGALDELHALWQDRVRPELGSKRLQEMDARSKACFVVVTDDMRSAAQIPRDRKLDPDRMLALCVAALTEIGLI